jgi:hypothetical protein
MSSERSSPTRTRASADSPVMSTPGDVMPSTNSLSPKTVAASLGSAVAILFWTIASATFFEGDFDDTAIIALTGATSTIASFAFGYLIRDPARS